MVDGENVVPQVHAVLDKMTEFSQPRPQRRMEGTHRQAHSQRHQHRHRRLGPRSGDGLRGAEALQRPRHDLPLCFQCRWHRFRGSGPRSRPGRDALHHLFENLHHAGNDDQRPYGSRLVHGGSGRRRKVGRQALRRGLDERGGSGQVRHRYRQHVRLLGLGGRPLLHGFGHRPFDHAGHRPG